ncbi:MAG: hypothetical protein KAQ68_10780 [Clostridiales bacterium]|nr:hypothetical protein [Clostridiales bacterium]
MKKKNPPQNMADIFRGKILLFEDFFLCLKTKSIGERKRMVHIKTPTIIFAQIQFTPNTNANRISPK